MSGRRSSGIILLAWWLPLAAFAQEYSFRLYGAAEGMKNLAVLSLAQDGPGFIWVGTEGGLYRYDGTRFRLAGEAEGLPCSTETHGLFAASDGALWANICSGVFRFDGKRFEPIAGVGKMIRGAQIMADGSAGTVLISTPDGLYEAFRNADGSFGARAYPVPPEFSGKPTHGVLRQGATHVPSVYYLLRAKITGLSPSEVGLPPERSTIFTLLL